MEASSSSSSRKRREEVREEEVEVVAADDDDGSGVARFVGQSVVTRALARRTRANTRKKARVALARSYFRQIQFRTKGEIRWGPSSRGDRENLQLRGLQSAKPPRWRPVVAGFSWDCAKALLLSTKSLGSLSTTERLMTASEDSQATFAEIQALPTEFKRCEDGKDAKMTMSRVWADLPACVKDTFSKHLARLVVAEVERPFYRALARTILDGPSLGRSALKCKVCGSNKPDDDATLDRSYDDIYGMMMVTREVDDYCPPLRGEEEEEEEGKKLPPKLRKEEYKVKRTTAAETEDGGCDAAAAPTTTSLPPPPISTPLLPVYSAAASSCGGGAAAAHGSSYVLPTECPRAYDDVLTRKQSERRDQDIDKMIAEENLERARSRLERRATLKKRFDEAAVVFAAAPASATSMLLAEEEEEEATPPAPLLLLSNNARRRRDKLAKVKRALASRESRAEEKRAAEFAKIVAAAIGKDKGGGDCNDSCCRPEPPNEEEEEGVAAELTMKVKDGAGEGEPRRRGGGRRREKRRGKLLAEEPPSERVLRLALQKNIWHGALKYAVRGVRK